MPTCQHCGRVFQKQENLALHVERAHNDKMEAELDIDDIRLAVRCIRRLMVAIQPDEMSALAKALRRAMTARQRGALLEIIPELNTSPGGVVIKSEK